MLELGQPLEIVGMSMSKAWLYLVSLWHARVKLLFKHLLRTIAVTYLLRNMCANCNEDGPCKLNVKHSVLAIFGHSLQAA